MLAVDEILLAAGNSRSLEKNKEGWLKMKIIRFPLQRV